MKRLSYILLTVVLLAPTVSFAVNSGTEFLDRLDEDVASGRLSADDALLHKFQYGFEPEKLPAEYRPQAFSPLKCATRIIAEFERRRPELRADVVATVDAYLGRNKEVAPAASYISPSGIFRFTYDTTGADAVPATDTTPANGVPDYVERCALYMDASWQAEITDLGFTAPPLPSGYYEVDFESMQYYGYTSSGSGGSTTITLHNDFIGFAPNDDPESNAIGAAKVTCAHEFKHASQRAQSGWSEGGWVELDATWAEEIVYDYVNDYYNYLPSGSPISGPAASMDPGSYEDCVWELYMTQTWGDQIIPDFWTWRAGHTFEGVLTSYTMVLGQYGSAFVDAWATFTAWNYATGSRAVSGLGYDEAASYPTAPLTTTIASYPAAVNGAVNYLAANMLRCSGLPTGPGTIDIVFDGEEGSGITLTAVIEKTDGTGLFERIALDAGNDAAASLSVSPDDIAELGFAVGNGATSGLPATWSLTVAYEPPLPVATLGASSIATELDVDTTGNEVLDLTNAGPAGSVLDYSVTVTSAAPATSGAKSIAGTTGQFGLSDYIAGDAYSIQFSITNGSGDDEWLTDVTLDFPTGFEVTGSTSFAGGTLGGMASDGATGDGAVISWHGDTGSPNFYGVIKGGETAIATVDFTVDPGVNGNQVLAYSVTGDLWGAAPHTANGTFDLEPAQASVLVAAPDGGEIWNVGAATEITWSATIVTDVMIELSRDSGGSWETLIASTPNDGSFGWVVTGPATLDALIKISAIGDPATDVSDAAFMINTPVPWLAATPLSGSLAAGVNTPLSLDFDATGLAAGDYTAYLVIDHNGSGERDVVPVTLTVNHPLSAAGDMPVFRLDGNYPNPFNPATSVVFSLERKGRTMVDVFDLRGRLVIRMFDGELDVGRHTLEWDGTDREGRALPSGTYLVKLRSGGFEAVSKMLLAR